MYKRLILLIALLLPLAAVAQQGPPPTGAEGVVVDERTGEVLPFVQVYFVGTEQGTHTDLDGKFSIENSNGLITLGVKCVGYKTQLISLRANRITGDMRIKMEPDVYSLGEVTITAKRHRERYRRKHNPAVDLVNNVIAHKEQQRPLRDWPRCLEQCECMR